MTIPRVLMAAAMLTLGFMIWGVHRDVWQLKTNIESGSGDLLKAVTAISQSMVVTHQKLDVADAKIDKLKPTGVIRVGKPRVKAIPHIKPKQLDFWQRLFNSPPNQTGYTAG